MTQRRQRWRTFPPFSTPVGGSSNAKIEVGGALTFGARATTLWWGLTHGRKWRRGWKAPSPSPPSTPKTFSPGHDLQLQLLLSPSALATLLVAQGAAFAVLSSWTVAGPRSPTPPKPMTGRHSLRAHLPPLRRHRHHRHRRHRHRLMRTVSWPCLAPGACASTRVS